MKHLISKEKSKKFLQVIAAANIIMHATPVFSTPCESVDAITEIKAVISEEEVLNHNGGCNNAGCGNGSCGKK